MHRRFDSLQLTQLPHRAAEAAVPDLRRCFIMRGTKHTTVGDLSCVWHGR